MSTILFISTMPGCYWGGSEELWSECMREAKSAGHTVFASVEWHEKLHPRVQDLQAKGFDIYFRHVANNASPIKKAVNKISRARKGHSNTPQGYFEFLTRVNSIKPDFICINQGGTFNIVNHPEVLFLVDHVKVPYFLISQHNSEHFVYRQPYLDKIRKYIIKSKKIFFVAQRNLEVAQRQLAINSFTNFDTIKNPCRLVYTAPMPYPAGSIKMAYAGRINCFNKGLDLLLHALSYPEFAAINWQLDIWGGGEDEAYIKELIPFYCLQDKVKMHGVSHDMEAVWRGSQLLLLPSINEGTPLTIMEAMMCGRAVITTDVGDNAVLVQDNRNGFIIDAPVVSLMRNKMNEAFTKHSQWQQMGEQAFADVQLYVDPKPGKTLLNKMLASL